MTPIPIGEYNEGTEPSSEPRGATIKPEIEKFLQENSNKAWKPKEVSDSLELNKATVTNTMNKMWQAGVLEKRVCDGYTHYHWIGEAGETSETSEDDSEYEPEDPEDPKEEVEEVEEEPEEVESEDDDEDEVEEEEEEVEE